MLRTYGTTRVTDDTVELSFRDVRNWFPLGGAEGMAINGVLIGDDVCGPWIAQTAIAAGIGSESSVAHGHASDNFRISLRGQFEMGSEVYRAGEFRLQKGWKPYPSDNNSYGPDGGWQIVMMADRRGVRGRTVTADTSGFFEYAHPYLAETFELAGDLLSDDPEEGAGESALATTYGPISSGKLNGSIADRRLWRPVNASTRAAVLLLGDPVAGPVVVLTSTEADAVAAERCRFDTEVFRLVLAGSCHIGDRTYRAGDMVLDRAGKWGSPVVAGGDGLQEMIVIGDRRHARPTTDGPAWPQELGAIVANLAAQLNGPVPCSAEGG